MTKQLKKINPIDTKLDKYTQEHIKERDYLYKELMSPIMGIPKKYLNTS